MNLDEIEIKGNLVSVKLDEVRLLEEDLWIKFPKGYPEYITKFGEGVLAETIRIYPPYRIKEHLKQWRQRIKDYWFWGNNPLPKERALESIVLGDTLNGDEFVFHPAFPKKIFVLPHEEDNSILAGDNLLDVVHKIYDEIKEETKFGLSFEPYDSREIENTYECDEEVQSPEGESINNIMNKIEEWIIHNSVRKQSKKALIKHIKPNSKTKFVSEGFNLKTKSMIDIGYFIKYEIIDKTNDEKIGDFEFHKSSDSYGSSWTPNKIEK